MQLLLLHGLCMALAFALVFPLGAAVARYRKRVAPNAAAGEPGRRVGDNWLTRHSWIQSAGTFVMVLGAFCAFFALDSHLNSPHKLLGLAIVAYVLFVQPALGAETRDTPRDRWRHRAFGRTAIVLAWLNLCSGAAMWFGYL